MAGRFTAVESPVALPGSCRCCGSATKRLYLDTGIQEEFYGAVYYCIDCFGDMAQTMGFITPVAGIELLETLRNLYAEREAVKSVVKELSEYVDSRFDFTRAAVYVSDSDIFDRIKDIEHQLSRRETELGEGEGAPTESFDDEGVDELRPVESEFKLNIGLTGI